MMTYSTLELSKYFEHRYKFDAYIFNIIDKTTENVTIFLDTGCFNTLIPRHLAKRAGYPLGFKLKYSMGGGSFEAEAFSIEKLIIGDITLERVIAFAGDYKGGYEDDIILGTNVINNWEMIISKKTHSFQFKEDPPDSLPNKTNIYQNYFDREGNYIFVQGN